MSTAENGGEIWINDENGKRVVALGVRTNGGVIQVSNKNQQPVAILTATEDGGGIMVGRLGEVEITGKGVFIRDENGKTVGRLP